MDLSCVPSVPNVPEHHERDAHSRGAGSASDTAVFDPESPSPIQAQLLPHKSPDNAQSFQQSKDSGPLSLIREAVYNPTDALNVSLRVAQSSGSAWQKAQTSRSSVIPREISTPVPQTARLQERSVETHPQFPSLPTAVLHEAWDNCWLVKKGWLRAEEAAWYVTEYV